VKTPSILTLKKAMKIMRVQRMTLKQKRMKLSKRRNQKPNVHLQ
jgi:hypothetical protein